MDQAQQEDAPLATGRLAGSEEALIQPRQTGGGSNSRALKIAGLTTLACLLVASQVFTAYMVFDQKEQIHTLQKNSEKIRKDMVRSVQAIPQRLHVPMSSIPLMMDYVSDEDMSSSKTPKAPKPKAEPVPTVEKQLQDLMQDFKLPHFNETFLANLQTLKRQMNQSEWTSMETWMRYWLIFQMAQQAPVTAPQPAFLIKTKCQMEAVRRGHLVGQYKPQCDEQGRYVPMQCWHATNYCWCVDENGEVIQGTATRGHIDCDKVPTYGRSYPARPLHRAFSIGDESK